MGIFRRLLNCESQPWAFALPPMLVGDISGFRKSLLLNFCVVFLLLTDCHSLVIWSSVTFWRGAPTGVWDSCCRVLRFLSPLCECTLQRGKYAIDLRGWESASVSQPFLNFPRILLRGDTILSGFQLFSDLCIFFFTPINQGKGKYQPFGRLLWRSSVWAVSGLHRLPSSALMSYGRKPFSKGHQLKSSLCVWN